MRLIWLAVVVAALTPASLDAQPRRPLSIESTSAGTRPVSPAVVATSISAHWQDGTAELRLIVLWRGTPGWFSGRGRSGGSTWGAGSSGPPGGAGAVRPKAVIERAFFGDLALEVQFNAEARTARVQGVELSLQDANVILVDDVDSPGGLTIVGTRRIDLQVSGPPPVRIEPFLRNSPELMEFLRCDTAVPDPMVHKWIQMVVCAGSPRQ